MAVLRERLPPVGRALEVASGSGQHAAAFAKEFPGIDWLASDADEHARDSITAWVERAGVENLAPPLAIDVSHDHWPSRVEGPLDAILAINLVHITPWAATQGLMLGAGMLLRTGGFLYLYGPYRLNGEHTSESNMEFEKWLKGLSPDFGVRDMGEMERQAELNGLSLAETIEMPANNFSLIFRKRPGGA